MAKFGRLAVGDRVNALRMIHLISAVCGPSLRPFVIYDLKLHFRLSIACFIPQILAITHIVVKPSSFKGGTLLACILSAEKR